MPLAAVRAWRHLIHTNWHIASTSFSPHGKSRSNPFYEAECFSCPSTSSFQRCRPYLRTLTVGVLVCPSHRRCQERSSVTQRVRPNVTGLGVFVALCVDLPGCTGSSLWRGASAVWSMVRWRLVRMGMQGLCRFGIKHVLRLAELEGLEYDNFFYSWEIVGCIIICNIM